MNIFVLYYEGMNQYFDNSNGKHSKNAIIKYKLKQATVYHNQWSVKLKKSFGQIIVAAPSKHTNQFRYHKYIVYFTSAIAAIAGPPTKIPKASMKFNYLSL